MAAAGLEPGSTADADDVALKRGGDAGFDWGWSSQEKKETAQVMVNAMTSVTAVAAAMPVLSENLRPSFTEAALRRRTSAAAPGDLVVEGGGEIAAPIESVRGILREGFEENVIEARQIGTVVAEPGRSRVQMLADHGDRVGMPIWRHTGKQVKCGGGQRVLVGPPVDV